VALCVSKHRLAPLFLRPQLTPATKAAVAVGHNDGCYEVSAFHAHAGRGQMRSLPSCLGAAKVAEDSAALCTDCHSKPPTPLMTTSPRAVFQNPSASAGLCITCHKTENARGKSRAGEVRRLQGRELLKSWLWGCTRQVASGCLALARARRHLRVAYHLTIKLVEPVEHYLNADTNYDERRKANNDAGAGTA